MKLQHLFTINLVIAIFFGLGCAVYPAWVFQLYGLTANGASIWLTRLIGGSILGYATLMWFGMRAAPFLSRRAIALALLTQDAISCIASLEIQLAGSLNNFGWFSLGLYGLLSLAYLYFLFARPQLS